MRRMRLHEYQSAQLMLKYRIPVPLVILEFSTFRELLHSIRKKHMSLPENSVQITIVNTWSRHK